MEETEASAMVLTLAAATIFLVLVAYDQESACLFGGGRGRYLGPMLCIVEGSLT
jgi:hypothetical protein